MGIASSRQDNGIGHAAGFDTLSVRADYRQIREGDRHWLPLSAALLASGLLGILYYPTLLDLGRQWYSDGNYSHGFLIPLVCGYLIWARRHQLRGVAPRSSIGGLIAVAGGLGLFVLSSLARAVFIQRLSFLVVVSGLVLWVLGRRGLQILTVPLAVLLLMIPPPEILFNVIAIPLQGFAARVAEQALWTLNIPVLREGNIITLANTSLEVAEACSGIRSMITLVAMATTTACIWDFGRWRGLLLVASAVPIAVITNAARVTVTGILAHGYGSSVAQGFFHGLSGWLLFLVAAVLLGLVAVAVAAIGPRSRSTEVGVASGQAGPDTRHGVTWRLVLAAGLLGVGLTIGSPPPGEGVALRRPFDSFPDRIGAWQGVREALPPSILDVLRATDYMNRLYIQPGGAGVWFYVAYYDAQRELQIAHPPTICLPAGGWSIVSHGYMEVPLPGRAHPSTVNRVLISKGSDRQIVLYWYQERGRIVTNEYAARLYMLADAVRTNRTDGALVRISAPVIGSEEATVAVMVDFMKAMYPDLARALPE